MEFLGGFDVISFDVFDTLLVRRCLEPSDVFTAIERESRRKGYAKARIKAERRANRCVSSGSMHGETSLDEIYSFIPQFKDFKDAANELVSGENEEMELDIYYLAEEFDESNEEHIETLREQGNKPFEV